MRGLLLSFALAAFPLAPAVEPRVVQVPWEAAGAEVDAGALFYTNDRSQVVRFDLDTGARSVLYSASPRRASITELEVGGGRLAIEVALGLRRSKVLLLDPSNGSPSLLASGRSYFRRNCGRGVKLEDVSDTGTILVSSATVPCGRRRGTLRVHALPRTGPAQLLLRRPTGVAFVSDGIHRSLEGQHLLTWGERRARVRDLATGRIRRFAAGGPRRGLGPVAVDARGRVLLHEFAFRADKLGQRVSLIGAAKRVVFYSADGGKGYAEAQFCGGRPVIHVRGRRYERLSLLDPPLLLHEGRPKTADARVSCDGDRYVVVDGNEPRAFVYDLPG